LAARFKLTIREGSSVDSSYFASLDAALTELEAQLAAIAKHTDLAPTHVFKREVAPVAQIAARGLVHGRGVHGGVDVRGDGSTEAWTGRWVRAVVERQRRESAYAALRRVLAG
jgi:hypothetical protein